MKITASRRDDILRERAEYNETRKKHNETYEQQHRNFKNAVDFNEAQVENAIRSQVPGLDGVEIRVESGWYGRGIKVMFNAEDPGNNPHKSLRWRWEVGLSNNGEITKESSSWSGLDAVTPEQAQDLMKAAQTISNLINVDWKPILQAGLEGDPKWEDYVSLREMPNKDSDFDSQLKLATIDELIGQQKWIKGDAIDNGGSGRGWRNATRWYMIHSQSDKFFTISDIGGMTVRQAEEGGDEEAKTRLQMQLAENMQYTERVKKEKLLPCIHAPFEIMDMEGNITVDNAGQEPEEAEASTNLPFGLITL